MEEFPEIVLHIHLHICHPGWTRVWLQCEAFNLYILFINKTIIEVVESCETWQVCANQVYLTFQPLLSM